jgi:uncharacterized protein YbjT (DUF2867 family)
MGCILVTGVTGNVGQEVVKKLEALHAPFLCAVRNVDKARQQLGDSHTYVKLDLLDPSTYDSALRGVDRLFLMYPPETSMEHFHGFIRRAQELGVQHVVYLSVKDVQYMPFVPHFKNEKFMRKLGIPYTFLRAGYFSQNLNMFLLDEIKRHDRIYVPAGKGKTSFIDVRDIAEVAAISLLEGGVHRNQSYVITGSEALDFYEVAALMTKVLKRDIHYANPTMKEFTAYMLQKGLEEPYVKLVAGIHLFTKLGLAKGIRKDFTRITKRSPIRLAQYIEDYQQVWK